MIWDSRIWKEELARDLRRMRTQLCQFEASAGDEDTLESISVAIDKFVFTSAFVVRKLSEALKLSDELESTSLPVLRYPRMDTERPIHFLNWHRLEQFYDLDASEQIEISPRRLCNLLIHSFVFMPEMDETGKRFSTLLFNSDHTRHSGLFEIDLQTYFLFIESVCEDNVDSLYFSVSEDVVRKSRKGNES